MEDRAIIDLYFGRDEQAITETGNKYGKYLYTVSFNVLRMREDAEECVNDTYMNAWNAIPPTRPDSLKAFLSRITRNLSINRLSAMTAEKRGGTGFDVALDELEECIPDRSSVEAEVEGKLLSEMISSFLRKEPKLHRTIFMRRYYYMNSVQEIAEEEDLSVSNVKVILFRMRGRLREYLESEGISL